VFPMWYGRWLVWLMIFSSTSLDVKMYCTVALTPHTEATDARACALGEIVLQ